MTKFLKGSDLNAALAKIIRDSAIMYKTLLKQMILFLCFTCMVGGAYAQSIVQGWVLDATTKQPISHASVYFGNTQIGTATNDKGQFEIQAKRLYNELIISAVGYESTMVNTSANHANYTIYLKAKISTLMDVTVRAGKKDWKKWGALFSRILLGQYSHNFSACKILNPQDIKFSYNEEANYLEVSSDRPILIENKALGYTLQLDMSEFRYDFLNDALSYSVGTYYENLNTGFNKFKPLILKMAYLGSKMHFYRSLFSKTLNEENFEVYRYTSVKNIAKENVFKTVQRYKADKIANGIKEEDIKLSDNRDTAEYYRKVLLQNDVLKWDTTKVDYKQYLSFDSVKNKMIFRLSDTLMVVYKRDYDQIANLTRSHVANGHGHSVVFLKTLICLNSKEDIIIDSAGYGIPNILQASGDMGNRRLAEQLPFDFVYDPEKFRF
ncbi:carboxypeptidase-like regulatory domain-containing protein [Pedobacter ghigonis]|uniref:carboxypeptidase-like regulatory domain-containing protein n=1 Tax=Pedobacter ghigonis TaxID=2730403 RepID=UPI00158AF487|nr:carboxypeptidase-like regulatory domain-containing protein [Pedobacter ghigonis]